MVVPAIVPTTVFTDSTLSAAPVNAGRAAFENNAFGRREVVCFSFVPGDR